MAGTNLTQSSSLLFPNGNKLPILGLGTWQAFKPEDMQTAVAVALEVGYRHFDTAIVYGNEVAVGKAIRNWIDSGKGKREDIFVTTKLTPNGNRPSGVSKYLGKSLENLGLDYVDLYLIHTPIGMKEPAEEVDLSLPSSWITELDMDTDLVAIWKAMEAEVDAGRVKSIGVSNFNEEQLERISKSARIVPANIQVECHVRFQQKKLRDVCSKYGITMVAYGALGSLGRKTVDIPGWSDIPNLMEDSVVKAVAQKHNKSASHVLIRFLLQEGISVIPKSTNPERIKDNFNVFDFVLDNDDMIKLRGLDRGEAARTFTPEFLPGADKHPEYPTPKK